MAQEATSAQGTRETYAKVAATYDEGFRAPRWEAYDHVTRVTFAPLLPPPGGRALDAGAGTGRWSLELLAKGLRVTLLDPSPEMLEVARAKVKEAGHAERADFLVGGIERIDAPDGAYDFVFSEGDPLSYVADAASAARELMRVLRPGGAFYVSCDSRWWAVLSGLAAQDAPRLAAALDEGRSVDPYGVPVRAFYPDELRDLFVAAGAEDVRVCAKVGFLNFFPDAALAKMLADPALRARALQAEETLAADPASAGFAGHLQVVGRKPVG